MKLYSKPLSPYSACVRGVAYLKDLPIKLMPVPFPFPEELTALNPLNRLPILITGSGETLYEAVVIAEYFEDHFPEFPVLPQTPRERARVRLLARVAELEVLVPAMKLFFALSHPSRDEAKVAKLLRKMHRGLAVVEDRLAEAPFAAGDKPTLADAWLVPIRFIMEPLKKLSANADLLAEYPKFEAYAQNARQHPVFALIWEEMGDGLKAFKPELA